MWQRPRVQDRDWSIRVTGVPGAVRQAVADLSEKESWRADPFDDEHRFQEPPLIGVPAALAAASHLAEIIESATDELVLVMAEAKAHGASWDDLASALRGRRLQPQTRQGVFVRYMPAVKEAIEAAGGDPESFRRKRRRDLR